MLEEILIVLCIRLYWLIIGPHRPPPGQNVMSGFVKDKAAAS